MLPLNFYSELTGLMVDVDIAVKLITKYYPDLISHLDDNGLFEYFKNIIFQWFISLFIHNFGNTSSTTSINNSSGLLIFDVMFLDGTITLFKAALGLVKYKLAELSTVQSLEDMRELVEDRFINFDDESYLKYCLLLKKYEFNISVISKAREELSPYIVKNINRINYGKKNNLVENLKLIKDSCKEEWPICIYDSESYYKVYDCFVYRTGESINIDENYIENLNENKNANPFQKPTQSTNDYSNKITTSNALIERKSHTSQCIKSDECVNFNMDNLITLMDHINDISKDISIDYKPCRSFNINKNEFIEDMKLHDSNFEDRNLNFINPHKGEDNQLPYNDFKKMKSHQITRFNYKMSRKKYRNVYLGGEIETKFTSCATLTEFISGRTSINGNGENVDNDYQSFITQVFEKCKLINIYFSYVYLPVNLDNALSLTKSLCQINKMKNFYNSVYDEMSYFD